MPVLRPIIPAGRGKLDAELLAEVATGQSGVVSRRQLESLGVSDSTLSRWVKAHRLHRVHPGVYSVGHCALSLDARVIAALLYAGEHAVVSHTTAAWVWALIETEPTRIHLTHPGRRRSLPEVRVHHSRQVEADQHRGLPVTTVARTLVDIAAVLSFRSLRRAVADADYRGSLDPREAVAVLRSGRHGSTSLRRALEIHLPELAETLSALEERFLELCESARLPIPEVNARVGRMRVDALWRDRGLVVELDGAAAHSRWAAIQRDRRRELALRAEGFRVVRYTWDQLTEQTDEVLSDLHHQLRLDPSAPLRPNAPAERG